MVPNTKDFESKILELFRDEESKGHKFVDITSVDFHRMVGGYPPAKGETVRMTTCFKVMYKMRKSKDKVLYEPPSGKGVKLAIRYRLPR